MIGYGVADLLKPGAALQLPGEFGDLGDTGGTDRMTLAQQAAGRIHRNPPTDTRIAFFDEAAHILCFTQAEVFVGKHFGDHR